jgi:protein-L-isoaspartate(D-aspartate) O-methyltransferase
MLDFARDRDLMVERQVARRGLARPDLLAAMRTVPRETFVPEELQEFAYEDSPLPIEAGQTISQPFIVAMMIDAAEVSPGDHVLEIGAGSGYAAAVLSRIAGQVYAIERHAELVAVARQRLKRLRYTNVEVRTGDGTHGWPEAAPFDAIIASAGGPGIPQTLKEQLVIGGVLVMPVGETRRVQRLIKVKRLETDHFEEIDLGDVTFVPLVGALGWPLEEAKPRRRPRAPPLSIPEHIAAAAEPLPDVDEDGFAPLFDRFAEARVVLLGEASHGTSEFYRARAAITRRLVEHHGFTIVAAEADWPDAAALDRYVRERPRTARAEPAFQRFPTWMWRNTDVAAFLRELRSINSTRAPDARAGFYGLDLYNLSGSIRAVLDYLDRVDPEAAAVARQRYGCLLPWAKEPQRYGRMALTKGYAACEEEVVKMLRAINARRWEYAAKDGEDFIEAAANARLVKSAEAYYRAIYFGAAESWNLRDRHMFETLMALLDAKGPDAKAVVWAHNSHIGDASKTEMGQVRDELNIGQLCRERFGKEAALIGFGTHSGWVACASDWDQPMEVKPINPALRNSYERLAHDSHTPRFLLDLREKHCPPELRQSLLEERLERFIGVIYRPETERWSHYSHCTLPEQFDAYVWFDETSAVTPLPTAEIAGPEETYPFGL